MYVYTFINMHVYFDNCLQGRKQALNDQMESDILRWIKSMEQSEFQELVHDWLVDMD